MSYDNGGHAIIGRFGRDLDLPENLDDILSAGMIIIKNGTSDHWVIGYELKITHDPMEMVQFYGATKALSKKFEEYWGVFSFNMTAG